MCIGENLEWTSQEPDMRLLALIKYTTDCVERKFNLIRMIQNDCNYLGTVLGIDRRTINSFDKTRVSKSDECMHVLGEWIKRGKGESHYEVTWAGLLKALEDAELGGIGEQLEEALEFYTDVNNSTLKNCQGNLLHDYVVHTVKMYPCSWLPSSVYYYYYN